MIININLQPQIELQIVAQAAARRLSIDDFVSNILETSVILIDDPSEISLEEFERNLDEVAEGLENIVLPYQSTHSREDIYFDHD